MARLTVRAAAERLGIGYSTLKQWIYSGHVRTTQTEGGHHRIDDAEIARLLARRAPDASSASPVAGDAVDRAWGPLFSARNHLRGFIEEVRLDGLLGQVRLRVGDQRLTAVITADAIRELQLRRGDDAFAVIKSTEVMIARATPGPSPATTRPARSPRSKPSKPSTRSRRSRRPTRT